ncbi:MAG: phosphatase PAP2 family protein [Chloroflexota bacterium]
MVDDQPKPAPSRPSSTGSARGSASHQSGDGSGSIRSLGFVAIGAAIAAALVYWLTVSTRTGQLVGELILGGRPTSFDSIAAAEEVLSNLSRSSVVIGGVLAVVISVLQRRPRLALLAVATIVGANLTTQLLKYLVLERTDLLGGLFYPLPNSFPSGHATAAASIAVALLIVVPPLLRAPWVIVSSVLVAAVGVSTLLAGWHRMADAVGGVFVATAWAAGLASLLAWRRGVEPVGSRIAGLGRYSSTIPIFLGSLLVGLGGFAYLIAALDPLDVLRYLAERGGSPALFWVGVVLAAGTSLLALGALAFALRNVRLDPRVR